MAFLFLAVKRLLHEQVGAFLFKVKQPWRGLSRDGASGRLHASKEALFMSDYNIVSMFLQSLFGEAFPVARGSARLLLRGRRWWFPRGFCLFPLVLMRFNRPLRRIYDECFGF